MKNPDSKKQKPRQSEILRRISARKIVIRLFKDYMIPQLPLIIFGTLCNLLVAGLTSLYPFILQNAIDGATDNAITTNLPFWILPLAIFLVMGLRGSLIFLGGITISYAGLRMIISIRRDLFIHFVKADYEWIVKDHSARLLSIFVNDTGGINSALQASSIDLMRNFFTIIGLLAYIAYLNIWFALTILLIVPFAASITLLFGLLTRKSQTVLMQETANFTTRVSEILKNLRTIKLYDGANAEVNRMEHVFANMERHFGRARKASLAPSSIIEVLTGASIAVIILVIWIAEWEFAGMENTGSLAGLLAAFILAYGALRRLASGYTTIEEGIASAIRVFNALDRKPSIKDASDPKPVPKNKTSIQFQNVHFRYSPQSPALNGVSFEVPQGTSAALVGMSGGGKTTILNLIPRFYDTESGAIMIGGQDIRRLALKSLHDSIALVTQDPIIFDDSVRDNIAYARRSASDEEIQTAARHAAAHDFIKALPQGYDTQVGEGGIRLSGGERQRIALARAILKDAPILLMDEPTSALDQESEAHIQNALKYLISERTTLIIAHRLSTIRNVDQIHVVHQGSIIERGTHDELIHKNGAYAKLYGGVSDESHSER